MSFSIEFMNNGNPKNKIRKSPSTSFTVTGTLREGSNIVDPVITIEANKPINANYAYISEFDRYYYVKEFKSIHNNIWEVYLHCDVLKSFANSILLSPCIVSKNSSRFNLKINDSDYKCAQNDIVTVQVFPNGFDLNNARFILNLIGDRTQNF